LSLLATLLVPPEATIVLGADDTVERRSARKITAKGCDRDAVRASTTCRVWTVVPSFFAGVTLRVVQFSQHRLPGLQLASELW
jgi:predicted hydrolase (HD superfamily)